MNRPVPTAALSLLLAAASFLAAAPALAQGEAHCAWLKITAVGKGYEVDDEALETLGPKRSVKATCYAQLVYDDEVGEDQPFGRYTAPLICLQGADTWAASDADNGIAATLLGDGSAISDDDYLTFYAESGDIVQGYASHALTIKLDKEGVFKKASWKTLGAQLMDNSTYFRTPANVFGGYSAKGSTVPAEKVPEGARAEMSSGMCP